MTQAPRTVRQLIHDHGPAMTPSDQKIARALLANYPLAGLATVAELSDAAKVSPPSVVRFVKRLGLSGHAAFQQRIQAEIEGTLTERASLQPARSVAAHLPEYATRYADALTHEIDATLQRVQPIELAGAVRLLADSRLRVLVLGDACNAHFVTAFHRRLFAMRPGCQSLDPDPLLRTDALMHVSKNDVIVAFDHGHAAETTEAFCRLARERGAQLILFTDVADSALSALARYVFATAAGTSSMVPTACLSEIVLLGAQTAIGKPAADRLRHLEAQGAIGYAGDSGS